MILHQQWEGISQEAHHLNPDTSGEQRNKEKILQMWDECAINPQHKDIEIDGLGSKISIYWV